MQQNQRVEILLEPKTGQSKCFVGAFFDDVVETIKSLPVEDRDGDVEKI